MGSLMSGWDDSYHGPPKELQGDYATTVESPAMLRLRKTSQTGILRRTSTEAVRGPVSPRTPGKSAGVLVLETEPKKATPHQAAQGASDPSPRERWWSRMDSATYNEPYTEDPSAWKAGSYTPQFHTAQDGAKEAEVLATDRAAASP